MRGHGAILVERLPPTMGGEDFSYFAQRVPGVLIRLGIRNEAQGIVHSGHSPKFRIDEGALPVGIATLVSFARAGGAGRLIHKG
jgi:metal-dependent amidase/aminoacylase/carboxypeptidase family protein